MPEAADPVQEIAELRALLAEREAELAEARAELTGARLRIEQYKAQLAQLRRMQFGRSSEKLDTQIAQLELVLEDLEESEAARTAPATQRVPDQPRHERRQPVRRPLPDHLPREERSADFKQTRIVLIAPARRAPAAPLRCTAKLLLADEGKRGAAPLVLDNPPLVDLLAWQPGSHQPIGFSRSRTTMVPRCGAGSSMPSASSPTRRRLAGSTDRLQPHSAVGSFRTDPPSPTSGSIRDNIRFLRGRAALAVDDGTHGDLVETGLS